ncbi:MAG: AAA family ATPase [Planctomycetota bacterium]|jgi:MoxR-like ATPase
MSVDKVRAEAEEFRKVYGAVKSEIQKCIVGHEAVVDGVLFCLFVGGHALLEGVPGLGKTYLVRCLSQALSLKFSRIQFTPDLMPADIIGTNIVTEDDSGRRTFEFRRGPVFANIILADEINRATPKTQSAMLEAMQEHTVTSGDTTYKLEEPFLVMATQNPIEMEGTYPLPEAQLDRFIAKLNVEYSNRDELISILDRTTRGEVIEPEPAADGATIMRLRQFAHSVVVAHHVEDYAVRLVLATHPGGEFATEMANNYVRYGSSPRGAQALVLFAKVRALLEGRFNAAFGDVAGAALPCLRHRIILNFEGEAEGITNGRIIRDILEKVPTAAGQPV